MAYTTLSSLSSSSSDFESVEERLVFYKKNEDVLIDQINVLNLDVKLRDKVLAEYTKKLEKAKKERDELKLILEKLQNSSKSLNALLESQVSDKDKTGVGYKTDSPAVEGFVNSSKILETQENQSDKGYYEVPPPFIGNYMPPNTVKTGNVKGRVSKEEPKPAKKNSFNPPIIEDWVSESEEEDEPKFQKQVKPSFPKIEFVKAKDQNQSFRKPVNTAKGKVVVNAVKGNRFNAVKGKQGSIFEERDFDVQAMMDVDYELATRLRAEEQR
uniref:Uncharacterized protein n=1 Tax=Tanacetum cinerariifolium TaxID=118510 RepID=A0A6L2JTX9_TANCI|nr:hypothetical protein [Tanacetum cinerariifolium]